jgi:hypothetical protein
MQQVSATVVLSVLDQNLSAGSKLLSINMREYDALEKYKRKHPENHDLVIDETGCATYKGVSVKVR